MTEVSQYSLFILQHLMACFKYYQAKNFNCLYDAVGTLVDALGPDMNQPAFVELLMPSLIERWNQLPDDDRQLPRLFECITSVSMALRQGFLPYAPPVFQRCLKLIEQTVTQQALAMQGQADFPDNDAMVCGLDLISGLSEGLEGAMEQLVAGTNLIELLVRAAGDVSLDVRQSVFALVGDLAKGSINQLLPYMTQLLTAMANSMSPECVSVCNNAIWAVGEIAIKIGAQMSPFIEPLLPRLIPLLEKRHLNVNLLENTAITIGRLALSNPMLVAHHLGQMLKMWCLAMRSVRDDIEKASAFLGLCAMIKLNPGAINQDVVYLLDSISSWHRVPPTLHQELFALLSTIKMSAGDQWEGFYQSVPGHIRTGLANAFGFS